MKWERLPSLNGRYSGAVAHHAIDGVGRHRRSPQQAENVADSRAASIEVTWKPNSGAGQDARTTFAPRRSNSGPEPSCRANRRARYRVGMKRFRARLCRLRVRSGPGVERPSTDDGRARAAGTDERRAVRCGKRRAERADRSARREQEAHARLRREAAEPQDRQRRPRDATATGKHVTLYLGDGTPVAVPGTAAGRARCGAVRLRGRHQSGARRRHKRLVVDTKYVRVE